MVSWLRYAPQFYFCLHTRPVCVCSSWLRNSKDSSSSFSPWSRASKLKPCLQHTSQQSPGKGIQITACRPVFIRKRPVMSTTVPELSCRWDRWRMSSRMKRADPREQTPQFWLGRQTNIAFYHTGYLLVRLRLQKSADKIVSSHGCLQTGSW